MDRSNVRYEVLQGEEENVPAEPVTLAMVIPPPEYEETQAAASPQVVDEQNTNPAEAYAGTKLPSYKDATTLPSYEEAEHSKQQEIKQQEDIERQQQIEHDRVTGMTIGTDGIFLLTFLLSFVFNWIGFLVSLCLSHTVAGRCGALSGLGLSIVKWVAIFRHNQWADGFAEADSWVWWLLIICGFMIFVRGAVQYARIKYEWHRFTGQLRRYYFF